MHIIQLLKVELYFYIVFFPEVMYFGNFWCGVFRNLMSQTLFKILKPRRKT